jgi:ABC-type polysaccharide/polyol phosphate transport system ATPase subunit
VAQVIELRDVSLWRRTQEEFHYDLKRLIFNLLRGRHRAPARRKVLDAVSLGVDPGEKVGIIGENGSGKTTLLKVICGILSPTRGTRITNGAIAPLIELGAGFDPQLSLIDNVIYYGLLLGIERRRIRQHVDSILDFAELQEYRNEPVKTLSSGMTARLGFSIATEFRPDILILDEVLAVGDESFARKCRERIDHLWDEHVTILVVSHQLDFILKACDRGIWIEKGAILYDGSPSQAVLQYKLRVESQRLAGKAETPTVLLAPRHSDSRHAGRLYAFFDGKRHLVMDPQWLVKVGLDDADALRFEDSALDEIPEGESVGALTSVSG